MLHPSRPAAAFCPEAARPRQSRASSTAARATGAAARAMARAAGTGVGTGAGTGAGTRAVGTGAGDPGVHVVSVGTPMPMLPTMPLYCDSDIAAGVGAGVGTGVGTGARLPPTSYLTLSASGTAAHSRPRTASRSALLRSADSSGRRSRQNVV
eukprot:scaffold15050_cov66-Phaeocystis_antarctica.AAC.11